MRNHNPRNPHVAAALEVIRASEQEIVIFRIPKYYRGKIDSFASSIRYHTGYKVARELKPGRNARVLYVRKGHNP